MDNVLTKGNKERKERWDLLIAAFVREHSDEPIPKTVLGVMTDLLFVPATREPASPGWSLYGRRRIWFWPCPRNCGATKQQIKSDGHTEWASMNGDAGGVAWCQCTVCGYWIGGRWTDD